MEWDAASASGAYRLSTRDRTLAEVGFVHCGYRHQVVSVAERIYADHSELVLLVVDPRRLRSEIKAESPEGSQEHFPHVYGPLELDSVVQAVLMRREPGGRFRLPANL
jgi:uncharacterized protein (DUF952 family)